MLESVLAIPFWIEFASVLTGGIAGGMAAVHARYDMFGTITIACMTGLGGGILRDILLQDYGIYAFQHPVLILTCAAAGIVVFYFHRIADAFDWIVDFLDNLSVGLWAVVSVGKALSAGQGVIPSIILGTITAVGGGIMRDILMAKPPTAFQAGTLYGTASLIGSAAFAVMKQVDFLGNYAAITCVGLVMATRYASEFFGWKTHEAYDYTDKVMEPVKRVARVAVEPVKKAIEPVKRWVEPETAEQSRNDEHAHRNRTRATASLRRARAANRRAEERTEKINAAKHAVLHEMGVEDEQGETPARGGASPQKNASNE